MEKFAIFKYDKMENFSGGGVVILFVLGINHLELAVRLRTRNPKPCVLTLAWFKQRMVHLICAYRSLIWSGAKDSQLFHVLNDVETVPFKALMVNGFTIT